MSYGFTIYGLSFASNLPIPGLRSAPISGSCDVEVHLGENTLASGWPAGTPDYVSQRGEEGSPVLRVWKSGSLFWFAYRDGTAFRIDRWGTEVVASWPPSSNLPNAAYYLMGPVLGFVLRLRGVLPLHASAVVIGGRAVLFMGGCGSGKSTTAAAFSRGGFPVLADDMGVIDERPEGWFVQPGYPRLNLWPDSAEGLFGAAEELPRSCPEWDKRYLDLESNGAGGFAADPVPLSAIYLLARSSDQPAFRVQPLPARDALHALVPNTYVNYLLDVPQRAAEFQALGRLLRQTPVKRLAVPAAGRASEMSARWLPPILRLVDSQCIPSRSTGT